jgi:hypothetical protein
MTTAELLTAARALYASAPSHAPAEDFPEDGTYCVVSAIDTVALALPNTESRPSLAWNALDALRKVTGTPLVDWNATHSTEEVLAGFDAGIAAAAGE